VVAPRDATRGTADPRPAAGERHGTACAGVACADGNFGASGVAPRARLMPIRLRSGLGSMAEADAFDWAARNGADVISCSWGPTDGDFTDPSDPLHHQRVPIPDSTRLAIESAIRNGRGGKGCVILFAAGNGNESVDNDGYASYPKVIAVAACNDRGKKSPYSDFGNAVWCSFPSSNYFPSLTPGIWTTDRMGNEGYNMGDSRRGDAAGHYTNSFGGTSSSCPGAAGVAALVLARNRNLTWQQTKDILRQACDRIDTAGGRYNAAGHSAYYGYGRLNARRAVELAAPVQPSTAPAAAQPAAGSVVTAVAKRNMAMRDLKTARVTLVVREARPLADLRVGVHIDHADIGDLTVVLDPPNTSGVKPIALHNRSGAGAQQLARTYDRASVPGLAALAGKSPAGKWMLIVTDHSEGSTGRIRNLTLEMHV
jgi:subtilisin family serine protease